MAVRFNAMHEHQYDVLEDAEIQVMEHPLI